MRTIKFRGRKIHQRFDNKLNKAVNDWLIGNLHADVKDCAIYALHNANYGEFVDCETVGQFTGLHDKNGVEIYEGDVVRIVSKMVKVDGSPTKDEDAINTYEIFYHPQHCEWFRRLLTTNKHYTIGYEEKVSYITLHYYEVIGNIHEEVEE